MDKKSLEKLVAQYKDKAQEAYDKHMQNGGYTKRYENEYHKYDELARALQMALDAADEHEKLTVLKSQICYWAFEADKGNDIRKEVLSYAESQGYYISKGKA